ncbi:growth-blocking peptide, long form-like [Maniola jurtina]|uniref:growth-blocking peptide, long form-like n=1 Tax=Maniola jurtina TaxID=191418 RepID=UPI001E687465|nr:growth-blocking peptide, long form-like [Maniola jurtina]
MLYTASVENNLFLELTCSIRDFILSRFINLQGIGHVYLLIITASTNLAHLYHSRFVYKCKMKNLYFIYFCSLLLFQVTNGGLAKGFLGTIHDTAHKVKDGITNAFAPKEDTNNKGPYPHINDVNMNAKEYEPVFIFATSTATPKVKPNIPQAKPTQENHYSEEIPFVFVTSSTTEVTLQVTNSTKSNSTTDNKDGRENFAGGCLPGKRRTTDGRCVDKF